MPVLRPLISPNNTINANPGNNSLVITDYADNLQRIGKIIAAMDTPAAGDVEVIPLQHAVAADLAPLVQRLTDAAARPACPARRRRRRGSAVDPGRPAQQLADRARRQPGAHGQRSARWSSKLDQPIGGWQRQGNIWVVLPEERRRGEARRGAARGRSARRRRRRRLGGGGSPTPATAGHPACRPAPPAAPRRRPPRRSAPVGRAVHRRLHPGRPVDQLADHHRRRAAVPAAARGDRPARLAPRAGLHREHDRRGRRGDNAADFGFQWQGAARAAAATSTVVGGGTNFGNAGNIVSIDSGSPITAGAGRRRARPLPARA